MPINITDYGHVRLTVTDIGRSRDFYDRVFALPVAVQLPPDADAATKEALSFLYGGVIYALPGGRLLGLRPVAPGTDKFTEDRVGLDHLSFKVAGTTELEAAAKVLDDLGIAHEPVKDLGPAGMAILEFRDPDGIALELIAPTG